MKRMQRNRISNRGFSLIELIVVVLIMGILAVGLTPQVLKWVNNARKASDMEYMHNLEYAVQYALMDVAVNDEVTAAVSGGSDIVLKVDKDGTDDTIAGAANSKLLIKTAEILGFSGDAASIAKFKGNKIKVPGNKIEIHINSGRAVGKYTTTDGSIVDLSNE